MIKFNLKNNPSIKLRTSKGFTLLEALVAISILMVAVAAPITIAQKGLSSAVYSKNQMIASYLAQDAIEYIKNKRDVVSIGNNFDWNNLIIFGDSNSNPKTLCKSDNGCQIDTLNQDVGSAVLDFDPSKFLLIDSNGFYQYVDSEKGSTNFTRQINIVINPSNTDEALVTVTVSWGSADNTVVVKTLIYNY